MEASAQFLQARFLQGIYPFEGCGLEQPFITQMSCFMKSRQTGMLSCSISELAVQQMK